MLHFLDRSRLFDKKVVYLLYVSLFLIQQEDATWHGKWRFFGIVVQGRQQTLGNVSMVSLARIVSGFLVKIPITWRGV